MILLTDLAAAADSLPALVLLHVDPAASVAEGEWAGELGARVEFPLLLMGAWFAMGAFGLLVGTTDSFDDLRSPMPTLSAMYTGYVSRSFDDPAVWNGGGGLALRVRPLALTHLPEAARTGWIDLGGRYGTRGWGMDGGIGWDLPVTRGFAVGPTATFAWEGGELRLLAGISCSFGLFVDPVVLEVGPTPVP